MNGRTKYASTNATCLFYLKWIYWNAHTHTFTSQHCTAYTCSRIRTLCPIICVLFFLSLLFFRVFFYPFYFSSSLFYMLFISFAHFIIINLQYVRSFRPLASMCFPNRMNWEKERERENEREKVRWLFAVFVSVWFGLKHFKQKSI